MNIFMNLLALDVPNEPVAIPESLLIAVLGMVIIFVVLAVLILIIMLLEQVFKLKFMQEKTKKVDKPGDTVLGDKLDAQDEETVAAISAAIMVLLSEERKEGEVAAVAPFRIRSIKRVK